jgi:hypothetical protein
MNGRDETPLPPESSRPAGWWTCPNPDSDGPSFPPEFGFEPPDKIDGPMSDSDRVQAADKQLIHAMLLQLSDQEAARRTRRIDRTMQAIRANSRNAREISPPVRAWNAGRMARRAVRWAIAVSLFVTIASWYYLTVPNSAIAALDVVVQALDDPVDRTYEISVSPPTLPPSDTASSTDNRWDPEHRRPGLDGAILYVRRGDEFVLYRSTPGGHFVINGSNGLENWMVRPDRPVAVSSDPRNFRIPMPDSVATLPFVDIRASLMRLRDGYDIEELPAEKSNDGATSLRHLLAMKRHSSTKGPKAVSIWFHPTTHTIMKIRLEQVHLQGNPEPRVMTLSLLSRQPLPEKWFDHQSHHPSDSLIESY